MLPNAENYGPYKELVETGNQVLDVKDLNLNNWYDWFHCLLNIFKDGIETDFVKKAKMTLIFGDKQIHITLPHLFFNLIMWKMPLELGYQIEAKYIFYACMLDNITKNTIKDYIDQNIIIPNRKIVDNIKLNNVIDNALCEFINIDKFAFFFANSINLQDDIDMMEKIPECYSLLHADLSNIPMADIKDEGMKLTNRYLKYIKDSKKYLGYDHCLTNAIRAEEGIKPRQYKEAVINIGTKPDGQGGIFPAIINKSFITGGVSDNLSYLIESSAGRTAQILSKNNIGSSGHFARILGLNNVDSRLFYDPFYGCNTKNFIHLTIKSKKMLERFIDRYYRFEPEGIDHLITKDDLFLIGKTILLRSPVTCESAASGHGVCYKCYGDLAFINNKINIGKYAAETTTAELTQRLLSAKHLLESNIKKIEWSSNYFFEIFEIEGNTIKLAADNNIKNLNIVINSEDIGLDNEDDYEGYDNSDGNPVYNAYIKSFKIESKDHKMSKIISSKSDEKLYLSQTLSEAIDNASSEDDESITIPLISLVDDAMFFVEIHNNELSKAMETIIDILNKNAITKEMTKDEIVQKYTEAIIDGGLTPMAVHGEILIMNQIRAKDDVLKKPNWAIKNEPYQILTLNQALTNNPSVTIGLLYQRLSKVLYTPLTFKKTAPSVVDPFFMEKPQEYIVDNDEMMTRKELKSDKEQNLKELITRINIPKSDDSLV